MKLLNLFRKESLARTRRRIKMAIKEDNAYRRLEFMIQQGNTGYLRDKTCYKVNM